MTNRFSTGDLKPEFGTAAETLQGRLGRSWKIAWCHAGDSGGSKRAAFEMVRELARRGHVVDEYVIRVGEPNLQHWPLQPYVRNSFCTVFKPMRNRMRPYVAETWANLVQNIWGSRHIRNELKQLAGLINQRDYDFVHIDQCAPSWLISLLPHLRVPSVVYCHESSNLRYWSSNGTVSGQQSFPRQMYAAFCALPVNLLNRFRNSQDLGDMRHAQVILTNSCYSREVLFLRGCLAARVCPYGVDVERFHPLSIMVEPMVLSVGRVVEAKQHHMVIEAVGLIDEARRPRVVIATPEDKRRQENPEYGMNVARLAKKKGVELEVRINPTEQELVTLYNRALAVVFVPIMEPFGLVALEAMACGTPVIGVREGGVRESVRDGISGLLVERDAKEIAGAIEYLQRHEAIRTKFSKQAVQYVRETWSWQNTIDRYQKEIGRFVPRTAASPGHTT